MCSASCFVLSWQVVGDVSAVKNAVAMISSRLRESQHRDRSHFHGRAHSPERLFDDEYVPHMNTRRSSMDGPPSFGPRVPGPNYRNNNYSSRASGFAGDAGADPIADSAQPFYVEELVFRILCPIDKLNRVVGESDGIVDLLQNEIGVDVKVADPVSGSDEQIITIFSEEGPDDELFPAQEALLHIQTRIVDLIPDNDNIIKTRLLVRSSEIGCLEGRDVSLTEIERLTGATIEILPKEKLPSYLSGIDEIVQIEGEIRAARDALVEVTSRLRSYIYKDVFEKDLPPPVSAPGPAGGMQAASPNPAPAREGVISGDPPVSYQNVQSAATPQPSKDARGSSAEAVKQNGSERREELPTTTMNRIPVTLVTRSTLEVVIPEPAVPKLITKSKNKLAQISELSGANVTLVEDMPDVNEKIIRISGTPEQAERAQSLLQGFILSTRFGTEQEPVLGWSLSSFLVFHLQAKPLQNPKLTKFISSFQNRNLGFSCKLTGFFVAIMACIQHSRNALRRIIAKETTFKSSDGAIQPLLYACQGVRYRKLEVILTTSIEKLGKAGHTVKVAPGYFRNHLMPKLLAVPNIEKFAHLIREQRKLVLNLDFCSALTFYVHYAVKLQIKVVHPSIYQPEEEEEVKVVKETMEDKIKEYETAAKRLAKSRLAFRVGINTAKFRARESKDDPIEILSPVTKDDILKEVTRQFNVQIEPDNVYLPSPLTSLGEFEVPLHFPKSIPLPEGKVKWTLTVKIRGK
ncbi:hypothetical protein DKX38_018278 [Salix brachista]|uniref:Large ribosomal subunit protein bL9c n=1 Tax=Salix brachista TaxID=2182728 RepID=A0A5N5KN58_9ROSI|nr:hypothetical protein DKX38_018278 [Salix brachista]